jgi:hypothetical protein
MDNIKDIIQNVIGKMSHHKVDTNQKIKDVWQTILSEREHKHTAITGFDGGVLSIMVDSSAWLYQMNTKKMTVLNKLQKEIPEVKRVQFKIGKVT